MDWFERLTGFQETDYDDTRARLAVDRGRLKSLVNGKSYGVGELELASLKTLRQRAKSVGGPSGRLKVSLVTGDVREMHRQPEYASALFQVASQFNLLEMTGPNVTNAGGRRHNLPIRSHSRAGMRDSCRRCNDLPQLFCQGWGRGRTNKETSARWIGGYWNGFE